MKRIGITLIAFSTIFLMSCSQHEYDDGFVTSEINRIKSEQEKKDAEQDSLIISQGAEIVRLDKRVEKLEELVGKYSLLSSDVSDLVAKMESLEKSNISVNKDLEVLSKNYTSMYGELSSKISDAATAEELQQVIDAVDFLAEQIQSFSNVTDKIQNSPTSGSMYATYGSDFFITIWNEGKPLFSALLWHDMQIGSLNSKVYNIYKNIRYYWEKVKYVTEEYDFHYEVVTGDLKNDSMNYKHEHIYYNVGTGKTNKSGSYYFYDYPLYFPTGDSAFMEFYENYIQEIQASLLEN